MDPRLEIKPRLLSDCYHAPHASFKMAAQLPGQSDIPIDSIQKIPENIAISYLPESESLSKKVLEKGLNYFTQGYIHDLKISDTNRGSIRVDARCWRSMKKNELPHTHSLHTEIGPENLTESYCTLKAGIVNIIFFNII